MKSTFTADATSAAHPWNGGAGTFGVRGTLGGGTLKLQWIDGDSDQSVSGNWFDIASVTAAGIQNVTLGGGFWRFVLTGSTSPNCDAVLSGMAL